MEASFVVKDEDSSSSSSAGCVSGEQELNVPSVNACSAGEFKFDPTARAAPPQISADVSFPSSPLNRSGRRSTQKRVISIPVIDTEGSRSKGGNDCSPPADSWTWRKYGQKPIKGSPYPRGYYRCSSSKGCPARKRVERSRADPSLLVITYACEHNHPYPVSKIQTHKAEHETVVSCSPAKSEPESFILSPPDKQDHVFSEFSLSMMPEDFDWLLEESFLCGPVAGATGIAPAISPADQESDVEVDKELFAGLEELPECPLVFRRELFERPIRMKVEGDEDRLLWHRQMEMKADRGYADMTSAIKEPIARSSPLIS